MLYLTYLSRDFRGFLIETDIFRYTDLQILQKPADAGYMNF